MFVAKKNKVIKREILKLCFLRGAEYLYRNKKISRLKIFGTRKARSCVMFINWKGNPIREDTKWGEGGGGLVSVLIISWYHHHRHGPDASRAERAGPQDPMMREKIQFPNNSLLLAPSPLHHPPPLSKGHGLLEGNMPGEAASLWSLIDMGERISPFGNKCTETPGVMLREELDFHCYWSSLRFSRKHNSAKNIVRNKIKAAFWPGEHVVDKNLPSQRFHFRNALKPKSLDDTDIVAIVPTPLESPLKLPNWNVLGIFFYSLPSILGSEKVIVGTASVRCFHGDDLTQDPFQHAEQCSVCFG